MRRYVTQGVQVQGDGEGIIYNVTTTPWGSAPSDVVVTVYDITNPSRTTDVTATVASGSATVDGDVITLPKLASLTTRHKYRLEIAFTDSSNVDWVALIEVWAEE